VCPNMLRAGIVGTGNIANDHITVYDKHPDVRLKSICDIDIDKCKKISREYNISNVYSDSNLMFENENLDIVSICTPPHTHKDIAIAAAEKKVSFLCEKPSGITVNEVNEMYDSIQKNNIIASGGYLLQFFPTFNRAINQINNSIIGKIKNIDISYYVRDIETKGWNLNPNQAGGGALISLLPHIMSFCLRIINMKPSITDATVSRYATANMETDIEIKGEFGDESNSVNFNIRTGYQTDRPKVFNITGTRGEVTITPDFLDLRSGGQTVSSFGGQSVRYSDGGLPFIHWEPVKFSKYPVYDGVPNYERIRAFISTVSGGSPNRAPFNDALIVLPLIRDAYRIAGIDAPITNIK